MAIRDSGVYGWILVNPGKRHLKSHSTGRLENHKKSHKGAKQYMCDRCDKKFKHYRKVKSSFYSEKHFEKSSMIMLIPKVENDDQFYFLLSPGDSPLRIPPEKHPKYKKH